MRGRSARIDRGKSSYEAASIAVIHQDVERGRAEPSPLVAGPCHNKHNKHCCRDDTAFAAARSTTSTRSTTSAHGRRARARQRLRRMRKTRRGRVAARAAGDGNRSHINHLAPRGPVLRRARALRSRCDRITSIHGVGRRRAVPERRHPLSPSAPRPALHAKAGAEWQRRRPAL